MTDLAERLRALRAGDDPGLAVEAADEIERLRAELAAAEREKVKAWTRIGGAGWRSTVPNGHGATVWPRSTTGT